MNELRIKSVSFAGESMTTEFSNGHSFAVPVSSFPRLHAAPAADRGHWEAGIVEGGQVQGPLLYSVARSPRCAGVTRGLCSLSSLLCS